VYRALRSNFNRLLTYSFDYGDFKIFGLRPKLNIVNRKAEIHPIAGTFKRTGDDEKKMLN
jgi:anthranilate synthase component 1